MEGNPAPWPATLAAGKPIPAPAALARLPLEPGAACRLVPVLGGERGPAIASTYARSYGDRGRTSHVFAHRVPREGLVEFARWWPRVASNLPGGEGADGADEAFETHVHHDKLAEGRVLLFRERATFAACGGSVPRGPEADTDTETESVAAPPPQ